MNQTTPLTEVLHREVAVGIPVKPEHPLDFRLGCAFARRKRPSILQTRRPLIPRRVAPSPERPVADAKHLRRHLLTKLAPLVSIQELLETHLTNALFDTRPVHRSALHRAIRQTEPFTSSKIRSDHELATRASTSIGRGRLSPLGWGLNGLRYARLSARTGRWGC